MLNTGFPWRSSGVSEMTTGGDSVKQSFATVPPEEEMELRIPMDQALPSCHLRTFHLLGSYTCRAIF